MKFQNETGAIISPQQHILQLIDGEPGKVEFPDEVIWQLHQASPGSVYALAHVHPPHMPNLSQRDITTLKAWTRALYPFPARMTTITQVGQDGPNYIIQEKCFLGVWESKDSWILRGKATPRTFEVLSEWIKIHRIVLSDDYIKSTGEYADLLLIRSYK